MAILRDILTLHGEIVRVAILRDIITLNGEIVSVAILCVN
jgi:hypothetical protein